MLFLRSKYMRSTYKLLLAYLLWTESKTENDFNSTSIYHPVVFPLYTILRCFLVFIGCNFSYG